MAMLRAPFADAPSCTVSDSCCLIPDGQARGQPEKSFSIRLAVDECAGPLIAERSAVVAMKRQPIATKTKWSMR